MGCFAKLGQLLSDAASYIYGKPRDDELARPDCIICCEKFSSQRRPAKKACCKQNPVCNECLEKWMMTQELSAQMRREKFDGATCPTCRKVLRKPQASTACQPALPPPTRALTQPRPGYTLIQPRLRVMAPAPRRTDGTAPSDLVIPVTMEVKEEFRFQDLQSSVDAVNFVSDRVVPLVMPRVNGIISVIAAGRPGTIPRDMEMQCMILPGPNGELRITITTEDICPPLVTILGRVIVHRSEHASPESPVTVRHVPILPFSIQGQPTEDLFRDADRLGSQPWPMADPTL